MGPLYIHTHACNTLKRGLLGHFAGNEGMKERGALLYTL